MEVNTKIEEILLRQDGVFEATESLLAKIDTKTAAINNKLDAILNGGLDK